MNEFEFYECPECGSNNVFDLDVKLECEDCGYKWKKPEPKEKGETK